MPIRMNKVTLGEEIEMLRDLEKTLRIAIAKATLIADSTGDDETNIEMTSTAKGTLKIALDQTRLAIYRDQELADEQIDDMVSMERAYNERVSMGEDLGR